MTDCPTVRTHLSGWVDNDLPPGVRDEVRAHLAGCPSCRGLSADLARLSEAARSLGPIEPPDHLFLEAAGRVRMEQPPASSASTARRSGRATVQWIAIAATLVLATAGLWMFSRPDTTPAGSRHPADVVAAELDLAVQHYERAIDTLESMAAADQLPVEAGVTATLRANLDVVDRAISESRVALAANPDSQPARESLFDALRQKVGLLQATVQLLNDVEPIEGEAVAPAGRSGRSS